MPAKASEEDPEERLASFLAKYDPTIAKLARAARRKMRARLPGAIELVYDNYNALVIGYGPTERASEAVFSLACYRDHVTLVFIRGVDVPDPGRRLNGSGNQVRHVRLASARTLEDPEIAALMEAALRRAKPFEKGPRRLVIKSVSAKQRPRR